MIKYYLIVLSGISLLMSGCASENHLDDQVVAQSEVPNSQTRIVVQDTVLGDAQTVVLHFTRSQISLQMYALAKDRWAADLSESELQTLLGSREQRMVPAQLEIVSGGPKGRSQSQNQNINVMVRRYHLQSAR
jgi:protein involved in sex pheromone biosynthesis